MYGWSFYDDQRSVACTNFTSCRLVTGPGSVPLGAGSAELAASVTSDGNALVLPGRAGTRLDRITTLSYSTYRQAPSNGVLAIALQLNVDFDLSDNVSSYQGRLVYEPYMSGQPVLAGAWQSWNTLTTGRWWGTKSSVTSNGVSTANQCVQSSPCTWTELLTRFPNLGIHSSYGAIVLKAGSGWTGFRGNVDALRIGVTGIDTVYDFESVRAAVVPATPPNIVPATLEDETKFVPVSGALIHRNIMVIQFEDTASQQTRNQIVQSISGTVVGGEPLNGSGDGPYYVSVAEDSSGLRNLELGASLETSQAIIAAYPMWMANGDSMIAYRKPKEGLSWKNWQLDRKKILTSERNWAMEAISAPMAWGCETGSAATIVGDVDLNFHSSAELGANRVSTDAPNILGFNAPFTGTWHGDATSELIAAKGNDNSGMTGVMWNASLHQWNVVLMAVDSATGQLVYKGGKRQVTAVSIAQAYTRAARTRARVINLSLQNPFGQKLVSRADSLAARLYPNTIARAMRQLERDGVSVPLLVIAAGNFGLPAYDAGFPQLASHPRYGNRVLVVGATKFGTGTTFTSMSGQGYASNYGSLVSIFAPGEAVGGIAPDGTDQWITGTSFAAPLVTGVAGLLFSFDSSLSASAARQLILDGARNDGRVAVDIVGNLYPFLDAYAALKAAASRPNAPLCGNRVHSLANGNVVAERPGHADEVLFTSIDGAPYTELLNVMHGGKRIQIGDYLQFSWDRGNPSSSHWAQVAYSGAYHEDAGGAFLSWYDGSDHDATAYVVSNSFLSNGNVVTTPQLISTSFVPVKNLPPVVRPLREINGGFVCPNGPANTALISCLNPDSNRVFVGSWVLPAGSLPWAYAPQGDFVLQGINYHLLSQHYAAGYDSLGRLIPTDEPRDTTESLELWKVDTLTGASPLQLVISDSGATSRPGLMAEWIAVNETGTEFVWQIGKAIRDLNTGTFTCTQRVIEYRALPGHPTMAPGKLVRSAIPQPNSNRCRSFGAASFSPTRLAPSAGLRRQ